MRPTKSAHNAKIYEIHIDSCAYSSPLEKAVELLHEIYEILGTKSVYYVYAQQNLQEMANSFSPEMMLLSRRASLKMVNGSKPKKRPDSAMAAFIEKNSTWTSCTVTPHCQDFYRTLTNIALPESVIPLINFLETHKGVEYDQLDKKEKDRWRKILSDIPRNKNNKPVVPSEGLAYSIFGEGIKKIRQFAFAMMKEHLSDTEMLSRRCSSENDIALIDNINGAMDNPYVIQGLRNESSLWALAYNHPKLIDAQHNCADNAMLAYLFNTLAEKPDKDDRHLIIITDDIGMRRKFANYTIGRFADRQGRVGGKLEDKSYNKLHLLKRKSLPSHWVETSNTIQEWLNSEIDHLREVSSTRSDTYEVTKLNRMISELELCVDSLAEICTEKFHLHTADNKRDYSEMQSLRSSHRVSRPGKVGSGRRRPASFDR